MDIFLLALALVLVGLNAFFVATEFAIVKIRPTRIEEMIHAHRAGAKTVRRIVRNLDGYLSATQFGITLASLGLGWVGEPAFSRVLAPVLGRLGATDPAWTHALSAAIAFGIITFLHIVLGELAPKSAAILRPEAVAIAVAFPMRIFYGIFFPAVWTLNTVSNALLRLSGLGGIDAAGEHHSEEELKIIVAQARSAGLVSASRGAVLRKALTLSTKTARHMMVPRNEVVFLDVNLTLEENLTRARLAGHTRYPLCDRELDVVLGTLDIREVLYELQKGPVDLRAMAEPVTFFPDLMTAERLLNEFSTRGLSLAVLVDEYGGASGIVTVTDIMASVMGEMDEDDSDVVRLPSGAYDVDGVAPLDEVEERLGIALHEPSIQTVAGFLMKRLGRMPRAGDRTTHAGYVFHVVEVVGPRVRRVRIQHDKPVSAQQQVLQSVAAAKPPRPPDEPPAGDGPKGST